MTIAEREQLAEDLLPTAGRLAFAVHIRDADAVRDTLAHVPAEHLPALCIVLAGLVDIDQETGALLAWLRADPPPDVRLFTRPVSAEQAARNLEALKEAISDG